MNRRLDSLTPAEVDALPEDTGLEPDPRLGHVHTWRKTGGKWTHGALNGFLGTVDVSSIPGSHVVRLPFRART